MKIDQATINGETTIIVRGPNSQHEEFQVSGSDIEGFVRQVSDILEYCHNTYDILKESYAEEANMVE